jgi:DNA-3-methyladenine glycosylase II
LGTAPPCPNAIDRWDGTTYRRVVVIEGRPAEIAVRQAGVPAEARLIVTTVPPPRTPPARKRIWSMVEWLLGPGIDLTEWYRLAERDPRLRILAERFRGVKPSRFPSVFEALVNAFACQQLSLEVGLELLNRLAEGVRRAA